MLARKQKIASHTRASRWPKEVKIRYWPVLRRPDPVLADGELTGHAHRVEGDDVAVYGDDDQRVLLATPDATVTHEEHKPQQLLPDRGEGYEVLRVHEYDPFAEQIRTVRD
jgi:hypothetical protein